MTKNPQPIRPPGALSSKQLSILLEAVEQSSDSIVITNESGTYEYVNQGFTKLTGFLPQDIEGLTPTILKSGLTPDAIYKDLWCTITAGHRWRGEILNRKKDGTLYWCSLSISPIKDQDGHISHYLGIE
ncbi:MAG: PAS domain-containing protein, partial [Bdellovibrionales bacterium]|nr:PAS domain-containing protein [Bdellovibrionales bacterium]